MPWKIEFALKIFTALEYFYFSGFLRNLRLLRKQSLSWNFSLYLIYFLHSGYLSNFCLPWKTVCPELTVLNVFFILQNFEQLALPLKNRVCPENFHCIEITIFEELALALKTEFFLKFLTALNIVFTFRIFEQLVLALKNRVCPEFTALNTYFLSFRILNNLRLPWKIEFVLKIFTVLKYFLSFRTFEQLELALKTEFALNFPPSPPRTPLVRVVPRTPKVSKSLELKVHFFPDF